MIVGAPLRSGNSNSFLPVNLVPPALDDDDAGLFEHAGKLLRNGGAALAVFFGGFAISAIDKWRCVGQHDDFACPLTMHRQLAIAGGQNWN